MADLRTPGSRSDPRTLGPSDRRTVGPSDPRTLYCCLAARSSLPATGALEAIARACSPRVMTCGRTAVLFDASGLARVIGPPEAIVEDVQRLAAREALTVRVAVTGTVSSAWLLAHAPTGARVVAPGREAAALAPLPLAMLKTLPGASLSGADSALDPPEADEILAILARWGLKTLGDFVRLPRAEIRTRLGLAGVRLHQAAGGEDEAPLVPAGEPPDFLERIELEWPIDGLEPLSFVLARACDALSTRLERADRGAVSIATRLGLVTRETHARTLELPAPMRDARVLRTLVLLDLESHPPPAAIDVLEIELGVVPGAVAQPSLLERAMTSPEDLATLVARLRALAGEARVGSPALVDTYDARQVGMVRFPVRGSRFAVPAPRTPALAHSRTPALAHSRTPAPSHSRTPALAHSRTPAPDAPSHSRTPALAHPALSVRRFRLPVAARVAVERGSPIRVDPATRGLSGGYIVAAAGPWRTSGQWWSLEGAGWDRDEWDVEIEAGVCYRLTRDRATGCWEIEGTVD